ncbi:MAG: hypothetical protein FJX77_03520, partial [Armatimonadetes bacterium]|nr:hypothetical protein [Armatimonadota bacterium]
MRRRIWLATALAVGTACLVLAQALAAQGQKREDGFPYGDLTEVRLEGQLISLGEAMAGKYGAKIAGGEARKQIGFATPEGE